MCVWCAYTGKQKAAPILDQCGKRIEGLWSGHYTGMVTRDEAGLHFGKVVGWSKFWDERYRVEDFQGNMGLWHSRTNSGGDQRFAHPFVGLQGMVALVGQGNSGIYRDRRDIHNELAARLFHEGLRFRSASPEANRDIILPDNTQIHVSDMVAALVEREYLRHGDPIRAIRYALTEYREEASTTFIFHDRPGTLYFVNTSSRIVVGEVNDGIMMSCTSIAFGKPVPKVSELPVNCVGYVNDHELHIEKLSDVYDIIDQHIPMGCIRAFRQYLKEHGPSYLADICDGAIKPLFPGKTIELRSIATHRTLETLFNEGEVEIIPRELKNPQSGILARKDLIRLLD